MSWGKSVGSQDVSLPHAATGRPGAIGMHVCACVAWCVLVCVCACMCFLSMQVAVYILLVWVSGNVPCVRWVVFVVVSYACLCTVCVCVHVVFSYACLCVVCVCVYACCS